MAAENQTDEGRAGMSGAADVQSFQSRGGHHGGNVTASRGVRLETRSGKGIRLRPHHRVRVGRGSPMVCGATRATFRGAPGNLPADPQAAFAARDSGWTAVKIPRALRRSRQLFRRLNRPRSSHEPLPRGAAVGGGSHRHRTHP